MPDKLSGIDEFLNGEVAFRKIRGSTFWSSIKAGRFIPKMFGKRDVEKGTPMTADAIFPIDSVTKTITSVGAMMLVETQDRAFRYPSANTFRSFAGMKAGVERRKLSGGRPRPRPGGAAGARYIQDLLLHTSGITYGFYGEGLMKDAYHGIS